MTHTYHIVTLDTSGTRRYHTITTLDLATAQRAARARHTAETGAEYGEVSAGERTLNRPRFDCIECDPFIGSKQGGAK